MTQTLKEKKNENFDFLSVYFDYIDYEKSKIISINL